MVQINQFNMSNLIVPFRGPVLPYFGIAQTANKWEWLGFEAVSSSSKILLPLLIQNKHCKTLIFFWMHAALPEQSKSWEGVDNS